jgi:hypothetical protein
LCCRVLRAGAALIEGGWKMVGDSVVLVRDQWLGSVQR